MKNRWVAAILNFFTLGLGTVYVGKRMGFGLLMFVAAGLMAYVEFSLKAQAPALYMYQFVGFLIAAVATAWDGYKEARG